MSQHAQHYDVVILGGGMVGASAALALAQLNMRVALIEQRPVSLAFSHDMPHAIRVSAIQRSSERLLRKLGVWQALEKRRVYPFSDMHIEDWQGFHSQLSAHDLHEPNLGHLLENDQLTAAIWEVIQTQPLIHTLVGQCQVLAQLSAGWHITLQSGQLLTTPLLVGADGANSQLRQHLGWQQHIADYHQHCIVGNVTTEKAHQHSCYQYYGKDSVFALLPLSTRECSIAWYVKPEQVSDIMSLSVDDLSERLTQDSVSILGRLIPVSTLQAFPIIRKQTDQYVDRHTILIGDAAHTVHPQAGQGVNLGFLDVLSLQETIAHALAHQQPYFDYRVLQRFERARKHDAKLVQTGMEAVSWVFDDQLFQRALRGLSQPLVDHARISAPMSMVSLYGRLTGLRLT